MKTSRGYQFKDKPLSDYSISTPLVVIDFIVVASLAVYITMMHPDTIGLKRVETEGQNALDFHIKHSETNLCSDNHPNFVEFFFYLIFFVLFPAVQYSEKHSTLISLLYFSGID